MPFGLFLSPPSSASRLPASFPPSPLTKTYTGSLAGWKQGVEVALCDRLGALEVVNELVKEKQGENERGGEREGH